jgi:DNA polymerase-1
MTNERTEAPSMTWPTSTNRPVHVTEPLERARAHLVRTTDDAAELLRWLSTKTVIAIDTETTGLDHDTDHARLVQVGDAMDGWSIPFEWFWGLVRDIVDRFRGTYVMHNATYDHTMLSNGGIVIPTHKIDDTRLQAHVLSSTGSLALKNIAQRLVDPRAAAAQQELSDSLGRNGGWTWETIPVDFGPYWQYAALDTILTKRVWDIQTPLVNADAPLSYQLEMAVSWVCEKMARKGAKLDREYTALFAEELTGYIVQVEEWCKTNYNLSPGSTVPVVAALERDGVQFNKRTATGKISIDAEVLSGINHPLASAVLGRRQAQKIVSTNLRAYLELSERDGRVHPSINTVGGNRKNPFESGGGRGVRTGRMSMDSPNLQNVPKHTKEGDRIRNCFVADEGNQWVKFDFGQIEMRLFAHLSKDPELIKLFHTDVDPFLGATRQIFRDETISKEDIRRQRMKNAFYAKLFGAGTDQFARTAGIRTQSGELDLSEASAFLIRLDQMYPGIRAFQREVEAIANLRKMQEGEAYIRSPLTNRKHVADDGRVYSLVDYIMQGTAGEILKMKMLEADQAGLGEFMILSVHDEIDLDVPEDQVDDAVETLQMIMNDDKLLSVPLTAVGSVGQRWGDLKDL